MTVKMTKSTANIFLKVVKEIGLNVNEAKTKYMLLSRQNLKTNYL